MKRLPLTDAFVDESIRGQRYLMACVLVEARNLSDVRQAMRALAAPGKRLHFHQELDTARRATLDLIVTLPVEVTVVACSRSHGVTEFIARDACLTELVRHLQAREVARLTIESRQDDRDDVRTISRARLREPRLIFDHRRGLDEPILWIADAIAWSSGAGGKWSNGLDAVVRNVIDLRP